MAEVLVTGGTGTLGRAVVAALGARGHSVRVLSRRAASAADVPGSTPRRVRGDLASGAGLADTVAGAEAIVHCASATGTLSRRTQREVDVEGTRRLAAAAREVGSAHVVYPSIVGIDDIPFSYYRTKRAAEAEVESSGLPWTILRATQFHDLLLLGLRGLERGPILFVPRGFRFQPVDAREVARRLAELVDAGPAARASDLGGPEQLFGEEIARRYLAARGGRRSRVVRAPVPGRTARAVRSGRLLCPGCATGEVTFEAFLRRTL